ncbi:Os04g0566450, partial [Oryza sativa Japonica Group]
MPVRSPRARAGSWWTHVGSGHRYTRRRCACAGFFCFSFHGRLWPRRCSCRFCSRWNPLLHTSHTNRFVASSVLGDSAITSASGSGRFLFFLAGGAAGGAPWLDAAVGAAVATPVSDAASCCCWCWCCWCDISGLIWSCWSPSLLIPKNAAA